MSVIALQGQSSTFWMESISLFRKEGTICFWVYMNILNYFEQSIFNQMVKLGSKTFQVDCTVQSTLCFTLYSKHAVYHAFVKQPNNTGRNMEGVILPKNRNLPRHYCLILFRNRQRIEEMKQLASRRMYVYWKVRWLCQRLQVYLLIVILLETIKECLI